MNTFFYEEELSRVQKNLEVEEFEIEEILDTRGRGKKKEYFVKWKGYLKKYNCWIPAENILPI